MRSPVRREASTSQSTTATALPRVRQMWGPWILQIVEIDTYGRAGDVDRWRTQGPTAPGSEKPRIDRPSLVDPGHLRPVVAVSVSSRACGSVFERIFDLVPRLFGVALELIDASLGAQARVPGGAATARSRVRCLSASGDMPGARRLSTAREATE